MCFSMLLREGAMFALSVDREGLKVLHCVFVESEKAGMGKRGRP